MTPSDEMRGLIERIEGATGPDREIDHAIYEAIGKPVVRMVSASSHGTDLVNWSPFYTASLDAAMTLVPEGWTRNIRGADNGDAVVHLEFEGVVASEDYEVHSRGKTWPIAICSASLRALSTKGKIDG